MSEPRQVSDIYHPDPDQPGWYRWTPEGRNGFAGIFGDIRVKPLGPGRARVKIDPEANLNSATGAISSTGLSAGVRATIPLFQGGRPAAQERQAQSRSAAALEQEIGTERSVIAQVRAAYSSLQAATSVIESSQKAVSASELSLEGVRAENTVGNRTILDILDAQQELLRAQVQLVTARRNAYVAGFTLLAAMGHAEARDLGLGDETLLYDPDVNYKRVRNKIWDWATDPDPVAQATRTVDTPTQGSEIPKQ